MEPQEIKTIIFDEELEHPISNPAYNIVLKIHGYHTYAIYIMQNAWEFSVKKKSPLSGANLDEFFLMSCI